MRPRQAKLEDLEQRLTMFERAHAQCDYMNDLAQVLKCREFNLYHINRLRLAIATVKRWPHGPVIVIASRDEDQGGNAG